MGIGPTVAHGEIFTTRDVNILTLAAHLRHWTPGLFTMPGDLNQAATIAGGRPDRATLAAAVIRIHAHHMLRTGQFGENRAGRRRVLKCSVARNWNPVRRYQRNLQEIVDAIGTPLTLTNSVTRLLPAFQNGSGNFLVGVTRLTDIPENCYVMIRGRTYYDFGPRS